MRDLWVQDVAGRGDTLIVGLVEHGLLASFRCGQILAARLPAWEFHRKAEYKACFHRALSMLQ